MSEETATEVRDAEATKDRAPVRTAGEAGWHVSRYNLAAAVPDTNMTAIVNLFKGVCAEYTPIEMYLLSVVDELAEDHPIIERFARRGVIAKFDEQAALTSMGRAACGMAGGVGMTICPTMGCNFDCPYCFEDHGRGKMSKEVQDDVVALAERMLDASGAKTFHVTWFGGEPLMAADVIESLSARLMKAAEERGCAYRAAIVTNGYLLSQKNIDMLESVKVGSAQVTIDGIGATHDATRYLASGRPTFDRIVSNLRDNRIPFKVSVRHNVHEGNRSEVDDLRAFIEKLAEESGNTLEYYPALVTGSEVADERGKQVGLLCGSDASEIGIGQAAGNFRAGQGHYCGAHTLWHVGVDDRGNLQKCWEAVDKPEQSFGVARDWDPTNPLVTASDADKLTRYLNTAGPVPDAECQECVWLPLCVGGCPQKRLAGARECLAFKDDPERYVLALHARITPPSESSDQA